MGKKNPTFVTTARLDVKTIAQLVLYFESKGMTFKSRNQVIDMVVYGFASMIKEIIPAIETTDYALRILSERGLYSSNPARNAKTLIDTLSLEDIQLEKMPSKTVLSEEDEKEALTILETIG